jgi:xanthine dehydrogenase accessory factor
LIELARRIGLRVVGLRDPFDGLAETPAGTFVVVATQGGGDEAALESALRSPARYVAFVGSNAKVTALKQSMLEKGVPAERLAELRGPAGIPIGAVTPEEIALSILADIVQARRRKGRSSSRMEAAE